MKMFALNYCLLIFSCFTVICDLGESTGTGRIFTDSKPSFREGKLVQDIEHMRKHLSELIDISVENISLEHMQFYYFKLHDFNQDKRLDGNELYVALKESTSHTKQDMANLNPQDIENSFADVIDALLEEADQNEDGYISWKEYLAKIRSFVNEPKE